MNPIDKAIVLEEAKRYTDKKQLGYSEIKKTEVFPNTRAAFDGGIAETTMGLKSGAAYFVNWDGVEYPCTGFTAEMDGTVATLVGNAKIYGLEDTGEPFLIICPDSGTMIVSLDDVENQNKTYHTLSIVESSETIHPIDPKFLPGVCLPVVELSGAETLTTEEQAQLTACAEKRMPVVVKVVQDGMTVYAALAGYLFNGEDREYHTFAGDIGFFTSTKDGAWTVRWN